MICKAFVVAQRSQRVSLVYTACQLKCCLIELILNKYYFCMSCVVVIMLSELLNDNTSGETLLILEKGEREREEMERWEGWESGGGRRD